MVWRIQKIGIRNPKNAQKVISVLWSPNANKKISFFNGGWLKTANISPTLYNQSFLNENACSGDESSAKVLFEHPSTIFVYTKA